MKYVQNTTITTMCMVQNSQGELLVQNRLNKNWPGLTFPGGHVEIGESFVDGCIREVFEETGVTLNTALLCGVKHYYDRKDIYQIVLLFSAFSDQKELIDSKEGPVSWMTLEDFLQGQLASGMKELYSLFIDSNKSEFIYEEDDSEDGWRIKLL